MPKKKSHQLKTVWWSRTHDAGSHGTQVVRALLGEPGLFPFPKSVYAVRDCIAAVCRHRPNALIVDFFAGSGTTFHATCLLNAEDGGRRRCILITNNEVDPKTAAKLQKRGIYKGDSEFERHGIFEKVTKPRCEAVLTGRRPDGRLVEGRHSPVPSLVFIGPNDLKPRKDVSSAPVSEGRSFAIGFPENVGFFRLEYLDPDDIEIGQRLEQIMPLLWLESGAIGSYEQFGARCGMLLPPGSPFAVLLDEDQFRSFRQALDERPDITHAYLVTDSPEAYAEMRVQLRDSIQVAMLYRDYIRNFRINTERTL